MPDSHALELRLAQLITAEQLARVLDSPRSTDPRDRWDAARATRLLKRSGFGFQATKRGRWYTTLLRLREMAPPLADLYVQALPDEDFNSL